VASVNVVRNRRSVAPLCVAPCHHTAPVARVHVLMCHAFAHRGAHPFRYQFPTLLVCLLHSLALLLILLQVLHILATLPHPSLRISLAGPLRPSWCPLMGPLLPTLLLTLTVNLSFGMVTLWCRRCSGSSPHMGIIPPLSPTSWLSMPESTFLRQPRYRALPPFRPPNPSFAAACTRFKAARATLSAAYANLDTFCSRRQHAWEQLVNPLGDDVLGSTGSKSIPALRSVTYGRKDKGKRPASELDG